MTPPRKRCPGCGKLHAKKKAVWCSKYCRSRASRLKREAEERDSAPIRGALLELGDEQREELPGAPLSRVPRAKRSGEIREELLVIRKAEESIDTRRGERAARFKKVGSGPAHDDLEKTYRDKQVADYATIRGAKSRIIDLLRGCTISAQSAQWLGLGVCAMRVDSPTKEERNFTRAILGVSVNEYLGLLYSSRHRKSVGRPPGRLGRSKHNARPLPMVERRRAAAKSAIAETKPPRTQATRTPTVLSIRPLSGFGADYLLTKIPAAGASTELAVAA